MRDDDELIAAYLRGDEEAFADLVDRHLPPVYRLARRLVGSEEAEDVAQETFLKAWKNLARFKSGSAFLPWILQIARNAAIDHLRARRGALPPVRGWDADGPLPEEIPDSEPLPDELAARLEESDALSELLALLKPVEREVLTLHYGEDLTFAQIGQIIGKPLNTVKSHHRRALLALRALAARRGR